MFNSYLSSGCKCGDTKEVEQALKTFVKRFEKQFQIKIEKDIIEFLKSPCYCLFDVHRDMINGIGLWLSICSGDPTSDYLYICEYNQKYVFDAINKLSAIVGFMSIDVQFTNSMARSTLEFEVSNSRINYKWVLFNVKSETRFNDRLFPNDILMELLNYLQN